MLAAQAGRLKGGLAKVAQLAAYDPGASLGRGARRERRPRARCSAACGTTRRRSRPARSRASIEKDLGKAPQALFAHWDATPLAAASLGQVHAAKLHDGTEVVVKVQYPGVADALRADLDDAGFVRKLAGAEIGRSARRRCARTRSPRRCAASSTTAPRPRSQAKFAAAWDGDHRRCASRA